MFVVTIAHTSFVSLTYLEKGNWSVVLRTENRLRVFENMVLRKILWSKWDEVREQWKKLHNEELYDLYSSQNIIQMIIS
jgi:hypothetical protein